MEGSCEYIEQAVEGSRLGVLFHLRGLIVGLFPFPQALIVQDGPLASLFRVS
jgi:hypothetical protein